MHARMRTQQTLGLPLVRSLAIIELSPPTIEEEGRNALADRIDGHASCVLIAINQNTLCRGMECPSRLITLQRTGCLSFEGSCLAIAARGPALFGDRQ